MKNLSLISVLILASLSACGYKHFHKKHSKHMNEYFKKADKNKDGFISKKEYEEFSKTKFSEMDLNNDNKISKEEIKTFRKAKWKKCHNKNN